MPIIIDTDATGHIWRYVDGVPQEHLVLCTAEEAQAQGLTRYGDAYPGERWETLGAVIRPDHVPRLYLAPPAPPVETSRSRGRHREEPPSAESAMPETEA